MKWNDTENKATIMKGKHFAKGTMVEWTHRKSDTLMAKGTYSQDQGWTYFQYQDTHVT
jgi:hypothetical protein